MLGTEHSNSVILRYFTYSNFHVTLNGTDPVLDRDRPGTGKRPFLENNRDHDWEHDLDRDRERDFFSVGNFIIEFKKILKKSRSNTGSVPFSVTGTEELRKLT